MAGHPVKVTCVHPGGIKTAIARNMEPSRDWTRTSWRSTSTSGWPSTSAQKAAHVILDGVRKNKARVLVGNDAKALDLLARVTGSGYQRVVAAVTSWQGPTAQ